MHNIPIAFTGGKNAGLTRLGKNEVQAQVHKKNIKLRSASTDLYNILASPK